MKSGTELKLKFKQLQRRLNLSLWEARGLLDTLWKFAADNCPAGDIGKFTDEEIAVGIDWTRSKPDELMQALIETRWLDKHKDAQKRLVVHGWSEHCEDSVHKSLARTTEVFADGRIPNLSRFPKDERPKILVAYELRYGQKAIAAGHAIESVLERLQTPENAPAMPSPTKPSHARPSLPPPLPLPNAASRSDDATQPQDDACASGGTDGRIFEADDEGTHVADDSPDSRGDTGKTPERPMRQSGWGAVADRLTAMGCKRWREAIADAKACGSSPGDAMAIIAHAKERNFGIGAIVYRLARARPTLPVADGWPDFAEDQAEQAAVAAKCRNDREAAVEETYQRKAASSQVEAEERERRYGSELDSMDPTEVAEICRPNPAMAKLQKKGQPSPILRLWLLSQLEKRAMA